MSEEEFKVNDPVLASLTVFIHLVYDHSKKYSVCDTCMENKQNCAFHARESVRLHVCIYVCVNLKAMVANIYKYN